MCDLGKEVSFGNEVYLCKNTQVDLPPVKKIKSRVKENNLNFVHLLWEVFSQDFSLQLLSRENCGENNLLKCDYPPPTVCLHSTCEFIFVFLVSSLISILSHEKVLEVLKRTVFRAIKRHNIIVQLCFTEIMRGLKIIFNNRYSEN